MSPENRVYQSKEREHMTIGNLQRKLDEMFTTLGKNIRLPYNVNHERTIEGLFRGSPRRIATLGSIEAVISQNQSSAREYYYEWLGKREIAVTKGYQVKTFEEYIREKSSPK